MDTKAFLNTEVKISTIPSHISLDSIKIEKGNCYPNSYYVSKNNRDVKVILGILLIVEGNTATPFSHAWNKYRENYFDVTEEQVYQKHYMRKGKSLKYFLFEEIEYENLKNVKSLDFPKSLQRKREELLAYITRNK